MQTARRVLAFIEPGRRKHWIAMAVVSLLMSVLEAAGALMLFVLFQLVADPETVRAIPLAGDMRRLSPELGTGGVITIVAAALGAFFVLRGLITVGLGYVQARVTEDAGARLASRLLMGYLRMPYPFHLRRNSAELIRNVNESASVVVGSFLSPIVRLCSEGLIVLAIAAVLLATAPVALLLAAVVMVPVVVVLLWIVQPRIAAMGRAAHDLGEATLRNLQQSLHGFRDVKVLGRELYFHDRFRQAREGIARAHYLRRTLGDVPRVALETALVLFVLVILVFSARIGRSPQQSLAVLGLFGYAALRILPALNRVVLQLNDLRFGAAAAEQVYNDLVVVGPRIRRGTEAQDECDVLPLRHQIAIEGVHFRYEGQSADALCGIDLAIRRGESVGLAGPSGGGKTTLVDVLLGLLPPTGGSVRVDEVDIQTRLAAWHRNLGVVPQTVYLVDDTLRRNIALGLEDGSIDDDRLWEALRLAQLTTFVDALPAGLDTVVGERGVRISGGQRQRVAIARALYRQPDVLVFDEGTSALDNMTEAELIEELEHLRGDRTMIIVAHRLTTVRRCDRIAVVSDGRIVDIGPYDDLLARSPDFRQLAR